jgi:hypothetical protein
MAGAMRTNQTAAVATRLLRLGNVGYALVLSEAGPPGLVEIGRVETIFDRPARVLRLPDSLPPAWMVGAWRWAGSPTEALLAIAEPGFDPAAEAVLEGRGPGRAAPAGFRADGTIAERRSDRLTVDVDASADGHLVLAEAYQDGWKASVDGSPAAIVRANVLFRAVAVPAGRHRVELRYRPVAVVWGASLTALGLAALAGLGLRRER